MSINLYPIIKQIGNDESGSTYLAISTVMPSRPYCIIKKLNIEHINQDLQEIIWEKIKEESQVLKNLSEESNGTIPKIYDYFVKEGILYLIQEYVGGETLFECVESYGLFDEKRVKQLLIDVLSVFAFMHSRGVIHGDINPQNIRLREGSYKPILINFGVIKNIISTFETKESISFNTPEFISTEQLSGHLVFASDIYSLGLTAIYLLTGKVPGDLKQTSSNRNNLSQIYPLNISPQLVDILNIAIASNPRDRYIDANEMLKALESNTEVDSQIEIITLDENYDLNYLQCIANPIVERNPQQSQFWDKADRMAVMIAGGIALGSAISQLPGAIAGGILAAGYAWYIRLS
jgi:serine/threonine protein kinase, bacterial